MLAYGDFFSSSRKAAIQAFWFAAVGWAETMATFPLYPITSASLPAPHLPTDSVVAWLTKNGRPAGAESASNVITLAPSFWARFIAGTTALVSLGAIAMAVRRTDAQPVLNHLLEPQRSEPALAAAPSLPCAVTRSWRGPDRLFAVPEHGGRGSQAGRLYGGSTHVARRSA